MSSPGTSASAPAPTASSRPVRSLDAQGRTLPNDQDRPTVPSRGGVHLPFREKMEERPKAPSIVSDSLPASADSSGVSAQGTRHLSVPNRAFRQCFPCDVPAMTPAHRFARAPVLPGVSATELPRLRVIVPPPSRPVPVGLGRAAVVRVSGSSGLLGLGHPASDLPCDSAGSVPRCVPTDLCFPLLRLR